MEFDVIALAFSSESCVRRERYLIGKNTPPVKVRRASQANILEPRGEQISQQPLRIGVQHPNHKIG